MDVLRGDENHSVDALIRHHFEYTFRMFRCWCERGMCLSLLNKWNITFIFAYFHMISIFIGIFSFTNGFKINLELLTLVDPFYFVFILKKKTLISAKLIWNFLINLNLYNMCLRSFSSKLPIHCSAGFYCQDCIQKL